jgi:hypothetical protein
VTFHRASQPHPLTRLRRFPGRFPCPGFPRRKRDRGSRRSAQGDRITPALGERCGSGVPAGHAERQTHLAESRSAGEVAAVVEAPGVAEGDEDFQQLADLGARGAGEGLGQLRGGDGAGPDGECGAQCEELIG